MVASREFIENVIADFTQGAEANRNTSTRVGNVVELTPEVADEVVIAGDLHGHRRNFNLIKKAAALEANPRRHLVVQEVCHGGEAYAENGGCMSHGLLEEIARLKAEYPERVHFILGNHELAELADYPIQKNRRMLNLLFRLGLQHMYDSDTGRVVDAYLPFLRSCPLAVRLPGGVFVSHSIPDSVDTRSFDTSIFTRELGDADFLQRSALFQLVWGRDYRQLNAEAFAEMVGAKVLVNGHEPCPGVGHRAPNNIQVILDCCGETASYAMLSTDREWTQADVIEQIRSLA